MNTWQCNKCRTNNRQTNTQCSWCNAPKPPPEEDGRIVNAEAAEVKLTQSLHNAIEKMNHKTQLRVWRWLEDNII